MWINQQKSICCVVSDKKRQKWHNYYPQSLCENLLIDVCITIFDVWITAFLSLFNP